MKKIIRLTEDDLTRIVKRVIEEQPTPCPPRQVTKPIVDSILPVFKNELTTYINDMVEILTKKYSDEDSLSKEMSELAISTINENFNLIYRIGVKNNYARYKIGGAYDKTSDIQSLVNNVINKVISSIDSNFVKKQMVNYYITKENIDEVKKEAKNILYQSFLNLHRIMLKSDYGLKSKIMDKMGRCPNGEYNLITNPNGTVDYGVMSYYEIKLNDLYKKLEEFI